MKIEIDSEELDLYFNQVIEINFFDLLDKYTKLLVFLKSKMQPKFKVGDIWETRDGSKIVITAISDGKFNNKYPICGRFIANTSNNQTWKINGKYNSSGDICDFDLIKKVGEWDESK